MIKLIPVMAVGLLAVSTAFAGDRGDSATKGQNESSEIRMACSIPTYDLKLTDAQRQKMAAALAEHHKVGCNAASEAKFLADAKAIMTPEQFAQFKAAYDRSPKMNM